MYSIHRIYFSKSSRRLPKDILKLKSLIRNQCPLKPNAGYKLHKSRSATNLNNIFSSISMLQLFEKTLKSPLYILLHVYTTQSVSKQLYNDEQKKKKKSITQIPSNMRLIQNLLYRCTSVVFQLLFAHLLDRKKLINVLSLTVVSSEFRVGKSDSSRAHTLLFYNIYILFKIYFLFE